MWIWMYAVTVDTVLFTGLRLDADCYNLALKEAYRLRFNKPAIVLQNSKKIHMVRAQKIGCKWCGYARTTVGTNTTFSRTGI